MQTLLQTQPDLSEMASRILGELFAHILGLAEPLFPLAFGEYEPLISLSYVIILIGGASFLGMVHGQLGTSASHYWAPQPAPSAGEAQAKASANSAMPILAIVLAALALLAVVFRYAALTYLGLSAVLFVARLVVGVG